MLSPRCYDSARCYTTAATIRHFALYPLNVICMRDEAAYNRVSCGLAHLVKTGATLIFALKGSAEVKTLSHSTTESGYSAVW